MYFTFIGLWICISMKEGSERRSRITFRNESEQDINVVLYCDWENSSTKAKTKPSFTRWFKYDRDKLWLGYTQIVPVLFEPPCTFWKLVLCEHSVHLRSREWSIPCSRIYRTCCILKSHKFMLNSALPHSFSPTINVLLLSIKNFELVEPVNWQHCLW